VASMTTSARSREASGRQPSVLDAPHPATLVARPYSELEKALLCLLLGTQSAKTMTTGDQRVLGLMEGINIARRSGVDDKMTYQVASAVLAWREVNRSQFDEFMG
jgi:hypothetical protein